MLYLTNNLTIFFFRTDFLQRVVFNMHVNTQASFNLNLAILFWFLLFMCYRIGRFFFITNNTYYKGSANIAKASASYSVNFKCFFNNVFIMVWFTTYIYEHCWGDLPTFWYHVRSNYTNVGNFLFNNIAYSKAFDIISNWSRRFWKRFNIVVEVLFNTDNTIYWLLCLQFLNIPVCNMSVKSLFNNRNVTLASLRLWFHS